MAVDMRHHLRCRLGHAHDVVDGNLLFRRDAEIRQAAIVLGLQLFLVAEDSVDLGHISEVLRFRLGRATRDDDAGFRVFPSCRRIAWRAWRTASEVTAQVLTRIALSRRPWRPRPS